MHIELTPGKLLQIISLKIIALELTRYHSFSIFNERVVKDIYWSRSLSLIKTQLNNSTICMTYASFSYLSPHNQLKR